MKVIKNKKGQSMVEFVLILPVFLLLLLGMVDMSRILTANFVIENASRNAARIGVVSNSDADIVNAITTSTSNLDASNLSYSITPSQSSRGPGDALTVTINYTVDINTPIVSNIIGTSVSIEGETIMRVE